jgi:hypothetical protein
LALTIFGILVAAWVANGLGFLSSAMSVPHEAIISNNASILVFVLPRLEAEYSSSR